MHRGEDTTIWGISPKAPRFSFDPSPASQKTFQQSSGLRRLQISVSVSNPWSNGFGSLLRRRALGFERHLDRIEGARAWRQIKEPVSNIAQRRRHSPSIIAGEVVANDDSAGLKFQSRTVCDMVFNALPSIAPWMIHSASSHQRAVARWQPATFFSVFELV